MKIVYGAQDAIDAQRVVDLLAFEGIGANVSGGYLAGAMGELPMGGLVNVWVADEDEAPALEALASADPAPGLPDDPDFDQAAPVVPPKGGGTGLLGFMGVLTLGAAIGYALAYGQLRMPHASETLDADGNGVPDTTFELSGEWLSRVVVDRNEDGKPDQIIDGPGEPDSRGRYDDNFDGRFESRSANRYFQTDVFESDHDGDGHYEWRFDYQRGVIHTGLLTRPDGTVVKRQRYDGGVLAEESFDADGDGMREIRRRFDTRGEQAN